MKRCALIAAAALAVGACDEKIEVRNSPPEVTPRALCAVDGRVYFVVEVVDVQADPVDLVVLVEDQRVAPGAAGDGLFGVRSTKSSPGAEHWIEWGTTPQACDNAFPELDGASGCRPLSGPPPARVSGRILSGDREDQSEVGFDLTLGVGCEVAP